MQVYDELWDKKLIKINVGKVHKTLLSASKLAEVGYSTLTSEKWGNWLIHDKTSKRIPLHKKRGVYILKLWVKRSKSLRGFSPEVERSRKADADWVASVESSHQGN